MKMTDLAEVKKLLISVMNLNPYGIHADKLDESYRSFMGKFIPYQDFSYVSREMFLKAELKDNIRIADEGMGIMLYPIASELSGHMVQLVQNQENSKKRGNRMR